jgi:hypothetical protein
MELHVAKTAYILIDQGIENGLAHFLKEKKMAGPSGYR